MRFFRPQPRISLATQADVDDLIRLYAGVWGEYHEHLNPQLVRDQMVSREEVEVWLQGGFEVYVGRMGPSRELVGAVRCSFPTSTCLLDRLAVAVGHRRRGIGQAMVEHALSRAKRAGVTRVWLNVPSELGPARELCLALGFNEVALRLSSPWGDGVEVSLMELPI